MSRIELNGHQDRQNNKFILKICFVLQNNKSPTCLTKRNIRKYTVTSQIKNSKSWKYHNNLFLQQLYYIVHSFDILTQDTAKCK